MVNKRVLKTFKNRSCKSFYFFQRKIYLRNDLVINRDYRNIVCVDVHYIQEEATGDISVYAKLEDTDFELIGEYTNINDYFVSRIKRKKFKDLQLKFYSNTRFSLETVTLEAFIGGYIKR